MIFGFFKKKPAAAEKEQRPQTNEEMVGRITHYFPHCKACVVKLEDSLNIGDEVHIKGHTTDIKQQVASMQIDGKPITSSKKGDEVGLLVKERVRTTDTVYKIIK